MSSIKMQLRAYVAEIKLSAKHADKAAAIRGKIAAHMVKAAEKNGGGSKVAFKAYRAAEKLVTGSAEYQAARIIWIEAVGPLTRKTAAAKRNGVRKVAMTLRVKDVDSKRAFISAAKAEAEKVARAAWEKIHG